MKLVSWNVNGLRACVNKGFVIGTRQLLTVFASFVNDL